MRSAVHCFSGQPFRALAVLFAATLLPGHLQADAVTIADTGYQLDLPAHFRVHRPDGAPDILLQADRPDGNGTIQVVRRPADSSPQALISGYEAQMQQALGNLDLQQENMRTVAGRSCTFRRYQSRSGGMLIRVQAVFYADGQQGFILHAIDTAGGAPEFEQAILSLRGPVTAVASTSAASGWGGAPTPATPLPAGRQTIGQTGYTFAPPAGWNVAQPGQNPGLAYQLPAKGAALELTWLDVSGQTGGDPAAFLDQTIAEVETGFGTGWHVRERSPHRNANTQLLFKRYGGQLGGQAAELMILGITDGTSLVLAYGYFAELGPDSAGPAMRDSILSIAGGVAAPAASGSSGGWNAPSATSSPPPVAAGGGWGAAPASSTPTTGDWGQPAPPPAPPAGPSGAGSRFQSIVIDDAGFGIDIPATFKLIDRAEGQTQWADPGISGPKIVLVIQTILRSAGQSVDSVRDELVAQVNASSAARMLDQSSGTNHGLKVHHLHFALQRGSEPQHFRYAVIDLPGPTVVSLSYVAPASLATEAQRFLAVALETFVTTGGTPTAFAPPAAAASRPANRRSPRAEPADPAEAYAALAEAVRAQDWEWIALHLTDNSLLNLCRVFRDSIREANYTEADARDHPAGTFQAYLHWQGAQQHLASLFEVGRAITGQRVENPDMILLMTQRSGGGESWLWFKRIKGRWMCEIN